MSDPKYIREAKYLPNGKPNPAFYEEMVEMVTSMIPPNKEPSIEKCTLCGEIGAAMYNYNNRVWYMECACEEPLEIIRKTKEKTITAWNVRHLIKQMEEQGHFG